MLWLATCYSEDKFLYAALITPDNRSRCNMALHYGQKSCCVPLGHNLHVPKSWGIRRITYSKHPQLAVWSPAMVILFGNNNNNNNNIQSYYVAIYICIVYVCRMYILYYTWLKQGLVNLADDSCTSQNDWSSKESCRTYLPQPLVYDTSSVFINFCLLSCVFGLSIA